MSIEVPVGWRIAPLRDLLEAVRTPVDVKPLESYTEIGIRSHGKGVFIKPPSTGAALGNKRVFHVEPDALALNIVFAWEGAIARTTAKHSGLIASHRFPMFKPRDTGDLDYLTQFFKTRFGVQVAALASPGGAGRNRTLNQTTFLKSEILVPPLAEQRKIAAILGAVDDAIRATEAVIEQTRRVKAGLLQDLLTRGIGPDGRPHTELQQTELGPLPVGWTVRRLGEIIIRSQYGTSQKCEPRPGHVPVLRIPNIVSGRISLADLKHVERNDADIELYGLKKGDVLLVRTNGNPALLGRSAAAESDMDCLFASYLIRLKVSSLIRPQFLVELLNGPPGRQFIALNCATSAGNYNISSTLLKAMKIGLPDVDEQDRVLRALASVDETRQASRNRLNQLKTLKAGLLQDLLTGAVRVTP